MDHDKGYEVRFPMNTPIFSIIKYIDLIHSPSGENFCFILNWKSLSLGIPIPVKVNRFVPDPGKFAIKGMRHVDCRSDKQSFRDEQVRSGQSKIHLFVQSIDAVNLYLNFLAKF